VTLAGSRRPPLPAAQAFLTPDMQRRAERASCVSRVRPIYSVSWQGNAHRIDRDGPLEVNVAPHAWNGCGMTPTTWSAIIGLPRDVREEAVGRVNLSVNHPDYVQERQFGQCEALETSGANASDRPCGAPGERKLLHDTQSRALG